MRKTNVPRNINSSVIGRPHARQQKQQRHHQRVRSNHPRNGMRFGSTRPSSSRLPPLSKSPPPAPTGNPATYPIAPHAASSKTRGPHATPPLPATPPRLSTNPRPHDPKRHRRRQQHDPPRLFHRKKPERQRPQNVNRQKPRKRLHVHPPPLCRQRPRRNRTASATSPENHKHNPRDQQHQPHEQHPPNPASRRDHYKNHRPLCRPQHGRPAPASVSGFSIALFANSPNHPNRFPNPAGSSGIVATPSPTSLQAASPSPCKTHANTPHLSAARDPPSAASIASDRRLLPLQFPPHRCQLAIAATAFSPPDPATRSTSPPIPPAASQRHLLHPRAHPASIPAPPPHIAPPPAPQSPAAPAPPPASAPPASPSAPARSTTPAPKRQSLPTRPVPACATAAAQR